ncbi:trimeric intracellular cation channel family protein [Pontibacter sp. HJ8]
MGAITASVGELIRDVLQNEVPLLLRRNIYALVCVAGGLFYYLCTQLNFSTSITELMAALVVILVRVVAEKFNIHLPVMSPVKPDDREEPNKL